MQNRGVAQRDKQLPVMVSEAELEAIRKTASKQERSMGALVRTLCKAEAERTGVPWPDPPPREPRSETKDPKRKPNT